MLGKLDIRLLNQAGTKQTGRRASGEVTLQNQSGQKATISSTALTTVRCFCHWELLEKPLDTTVVTVAHCNWYYTLNCPSIFVYTTLESMSPAELSAELIPPTHIL